MTGRRAGTGLPQQQFMKETGHCVIYALGSGLTDHPDPFPIDVIDCFDNALSIERTTQSLGQREDSGRILPEVLR